MKVKIRVTSIYDDGEESTVEKWIDAPIPGVQLHEEWAEDWLYPETGTGRFAGACKHCEAAIEYINAAPNGEPERLIPRHADEMPGLPATCQLPEPYERTPDAGYFVEILECEEIPFLIGKTYEYGT